MWLSSDRGLLPHEFQPSHEFRPLSVPRSHELCPVSREILDSGYGDVFPGLHPIFFHVVLEPQDKIFFFHNRYAFLWFNKVGTAFDSSGNEQSPPFLIMSFRK